MNCLNKLITGFSGEALREEYWREKLRRIGSHLSTVKVFYHQTLHYAIYRVWDSILGLHTHLLYSLFGDKYMIVHFHSYPMKCVVQIEATVVGSRQVCIENWSMTVFELQVFRRLCVWPKTVANASLVTVCRVAPVLLINVPCWMWQKPYIMTFKLIIIHQRLWLIYVQTTTGGHLVKLKWFSTIQGGPWPP